MQRLAALADADAQAAGDEVGNEQVLDERIRMEHRRSELRMTQDPREGLARPTGGEGEGQRLRECWQVETQAGLGVQQIRDWLSEGQAAAKCAIFAGGCTSARPSGPSSRGKTCETAPRSSPGLRPENCARGPR